MNPTAIDNMSWAMAEVYAAVTDRIMINLAHHFPYVQHDMHMGSFEYQSIMLAQMGKVEKETIAIIAGSLGNADEALKQALETAILEGLKNEEPKLRKAAMQGLLNGGVPQLAPSQMQAFTYFYNQSADKLNLVNTVMLESTKAAYQSTVADISQKIATTQSILNASAGEVITGVSTWNKAMHDGVQKMVKNGLTGFIDHGGHKWSPEAYVAMDVRTTMFNTARQATWERQEQYGSDLYQVSSHNGARPLCYPWQGKVISTSGRTGITQDIDGNEVIIHSQDEIESFRYGGGLFGVNCGHYPMTFIPNFSSLKGEPQDPDENAKTYAESQQQRALERKLREEKRDLEVMKAQGASPEEINAQKERVRSASADIDQFCDETGRTRKRNREQAPTRAEWSTGNGNVTRYNGGYIGTNETPPPKGVIQNIPKPTPNVAQQVTQTAVQTHTISNATTMQELAEAVKDKYGVVVSDEVKNLDFGLVKQGVMGIDSIADDFPEVGEELKQIVASKRGVMSCNGGTITFNPFYYADSSDELQKVIDRCTASHWWPQNTSAQSIGVHEAGHSIEWFIVHHNPTYQYSWEYAEAWNKCTEAKAIVSEACKAIKQTPNGKGMKNAQIIATTSRYAQETASEALAEAFADVYTNGENASPFSQKVVELTTKRYKQFGGKGNGR